VREALIHLVQMGIDLDADLNNSWTIAEEPASDDFHTFILLVCTSPFGADEQVSFYAQGRASEFHLLN
jgi:hypothetical protein